MYAVSGSYRVYISFLLLLCAAFFSAPTLANDGYWSTNERRFIPQTEVNSRVQDILDGGVKRPANSSTSITSPTPTYTKNSTGGLSATTQNVIRNMGQPSTFSSTINNSVNSAKTALKSCVRSPACAGRTLGTGGLLYEGIRGWKDVYDLTLGDDGQIEREVPYLPNPPANETEVYLPEVPPEQRTPSYLQTGSTLNHIPKSSYPNCPSNWGNYIVVECADTHPARSYWRIKYCSPSISGVNLKGFISSTSMCQYDTGEPASNKKPVPVSEQELDNLIDEGYQPAVSDAPITLLSGGSPESITLSTPSPVQLPSTTTTNTSSAGTTTTVTNQTINYNVVNNSTPSPSINSATTTNTTTYDSTGNVTDTSTSTTTETGVQSDVPLRVPSPSPAPIDFELPSFCSWAKTVCDWIGWTQEPIDDEPDLSGLISEFVPLEDEFNLGIGDGSCPSPIQINITFIGKTVEISYEPFCEFLEMIRPFVLAAAYLLAAYLYLGVLKRG